TTDSAMVPISTKDACSGVRWRNRVMRPMESTPTIGQKRSSKKKNTLREAMSALRTTTAQTASSSARQLNEHLLQLRLPHQLVRLAHVVRRQHDRHPPLGPEVGDVTADAHGHVRVEAERRLVEKEELGVVHERLGERDTLLEPRRELAVGRPPVGAELAELD